MFPCAAQGYWVAGLTFGEGCLIFGGAFVDLDVMAFDTVAGFRGCMGGLLADTGVESRMVKDMYGCERIGGNDGWVQHDTSGAYQS